MTSNKINKPNAKKEKNEKVYVYPEYTNVGVRIHKTLLKFIDELSVKNRRKRSAMIVELLRESLIQRDMMRENDN